VLHVLPFFFACLDLLNTISASKTGGRAKHACNAIVVCTLTYQFCLLIWGMRSAGGLTWHHPYAPALCTKSKECRHCGALIFWSCFLHPHILEFICYRFWGWLLSSLIMQVVRNYVSVLRIENQIEKAIEHIACIFNSCYHILIP
jgi:hypothetical protein